MASSRAISSFINLDGKRGIKGESFTAPLANRLIKVSAVFVLYFLNVRPLRQQGHTDTYCLPFQEYSQSSCTKGLQWRLITKLKTHPKHYWLCSKNTSTITATTVLIEEIKCPLLSVCIQTDPLSQTSEWMYSILNVWSVYGLLFMWSMLQLRLHKAGSCTIRAAERSNSSFT